jgi:hypothetical protein
MLEQTLIPVVDPSPLPAPYWVFKLLLNLTFFLHILAMNLLLGSGILALLAKWKSNTSEYSERLFYEISRMLPSILPATITLGVAPLLFVQVLYGQFFYTSSIIVGWPWFLVLGLLTAAYYGFYYASFRKREHSNRAAWAVSISLLLTTLVGFIYSNNMTLSLTPGRWSSKYFSSPAGWSLNLDERTLIPRFLHFFVAAIAVGGLLIAFKGLLRLKEEKDYARYLIRFGAKAFMYATMTQFLVGIWFLGVLPSAQRMLFMGNNYLDTGLLTLAIVGAIGTIVLISGALHCENPVPGLYSGTALTILVVGLMIVSRDMLRDAYLQPYLLSSPARIQWEVFPLFLLVFLAGLFVWLVMMKRYPFLQKKSQQEPVTAGAGTQKSSRVM